jgi:uncharacterized membrane protein (DUF485 family)
MIAPEEGFMLREYLKIARPFLVLLLLFAIGRWTIGVRGLDYSKGHHIFSLVTLTLLGCIFCAAFARRWLGYPIMRAVGLGMLLGFSAQLVIVLATALSYMLGMHTYFNHPTALNAEGPLAFGPAMGRRLGGLVVNTVFAGIAAALGWFFGGALPDDRAPRRETLA